MLTKFFAQDNATAKLSSILILASSLITMVAKGLPFLPASISVILLILGGVFTVGAQFFQENKVVKASSWLTLAYLVVNYLATDQLAFPNAKEILVTLAGALTLVANFTKQEPSDAKPPKTDQ